MMRATLERVEPDAPIRLDARQARLNQERIAKVGLDCEPFLDTDSMAELRSKADRYTLDWFYLNHQKSPASKAAAKVASSHAAAVRKRIAELEAEAAAPRPEPNYEIGTVYVAGYGPYVKIGFTAGPVAARLAGISTPLPFNIYGTFPNATRALERELHARFAHQRLNGEWFHRSADVAKWIKRKCPR